MEGTSRGVEDNVAAPAARGPPIRTCSTPRSTWWPRSSQARSTRTPVHPRGTQWRARGLASSLEDPSTGAEVARADGGSWMSRSCTSARRSWCRTWRDGGASECRSCPTPRTSRSRPTGPARCSPHRRASSTWCASAPIYAREGIPHLWLVDPVERILEAFELHEGRWVLIASVEDDEPVSIAPFEAVTFSLGELWD